MAQVGIEKLLEAGVHFGHQTRRWNPKMRRFIHGERDGIYIIDLLKTADLLAQAQRFVAELSRHGGTVLFVGTKKQARDAIAEVAQAAGMPYVNHRWLGGLLTNFQTMLLRIRRLHDLERYESEGQLELLPTRERLAAQADLAKLRANLGGVKDMQRVPDAVFVVDLNTEEIAVREAQRLGIPIIGLVDTNCDPDGVQFVIPGNDDAIRSCALITSAIGAEVSEGRAIFRAEEERARQEAEEQAKREAEERARREAKREEEEQEQAAREAAEAAFAAHKAAQAAQEGGKAQPAPAASIPPTRVGPDRGGQGAQETVKPQAATAPTAAPAPAAPAAAPAPAAPATPAPAAPAAAPAPAPAAPAPAATPPPSDPGSGQAGSGGSGQAGSGGSGQPAPGGGQDQPAAAPPQPTEAQKGGSQ